VPWTAIETTSLFQLKANTIFLIEIYFRSAHLTLPDINQHLFVYFTVKTSIRHQRKKLFFFNFRFSNFVQFLVDFARGTTRYHPGDWAHHPSILPQIHRLKKQWLKRRQPS
jgi:hypothetical protein